MSSVFKTLKDLEDANRVVTLKSVFKQGKTTVMPARRGNGYMGIKRLSDLDKQKLSYWADSDSKCTLYEGKTFDLSNEEHRIDWEWVKHCPCVCESLDDVQKTPGAEFYVHIEEIESDKALSKYDLVYTAETYVREDSSDNYALRARLLSVNMDGDSPKMIKNFLLDQAHLNPKKIIEIYSSKNTGLRLMFIKAVDKGVIRLDSGMYRYGMSILGTTEDTAIAWMANSENKSIVDEIHRETEPEYFAKPENEIKDSEKAKTPTTKARTKK